MKPDTMGDDLLNIEEEYRRAEAGKRLANYLIDIFSFYILAFGVGIFIALFSPSTINQFSDTSAEFAIIDRVLSLFFYALYMSVIEAITKGKSLGKLITKTRVVNLDGSQISAATAFARGFSRAVPFCVFSAFGNPCNPWQDRWTNTMVVEENSNLRIGM